MKLKKSLKNRTCSNCQEPIDKGSLYGQRSKTIIDIEGDKHPQDSFLVTGHLDDLIEILDDLEPIVNYDPIL